MSMSNEGKQEQIEYLEDNANNILKQIRIFELEITTREHRLKELNKHLLNINRGIKELKEGK